VLEPARIAGRRGLVLVDRSLGGNRRLTQGQNTTVSAVCALFDGPEEPYLVAYHNHFARWPIHPDVLRPLAELQHRLNEETAHEFPEWEPV